VLDEARFDPDWTPRQQEREREGLTPIPGVQQESRRRTKDLDTLVALDLVAVLVLVRVLVRVLATLQIHATIKIAAKTAQRERERDTKQGGRRRKETKNNNGNSNSRSQVEHQINTFLSLPFASCVPADSQNVMRISHA